ncbi:MAG: acetoin utilization protein AcuC [Frankiaceae bacterium]
MVVSDSTLIIWDDELTSYDPGPGHPLRPLRLDLTVALAREVGILTGPSVTVAAPRRADDDLLALVHDPAYIAFVKSTQDPARSSALWSQALRHGLGTGDNPIFDRMHDSAALVTGGSVDAAGAVWEGRAQHAVNIAGGLHHAKRDQASGFCVYDDPAVAIAWLLAAGASRVAYVDIDVHHGDGVQAAFYADPRVLTISLHESGRTLFPGTGWPDEAGAGAALGASVNVALPAGTGDRGWQRAFGSVVPPLIRAFRPQVLVTQSGCDTHVRDPLANLRCTVDGQRAAYRQLHELAHEVCDGRWVAVGGGGYDLVGVVPRSWTHLLAEATGAPLPEHTPQGWRDYVAEHAGGRAPTTFLDLEPGGVGASPGPSLDSAPDALSGAGSSHADAAVDAAIAATRKAVFPAHGLQP